MLRHRARLFSLGLAAAILNPAFGAVAQDNIEGEVEAVIDKDSVTRLVFEQDGNAYKTYAVRVGEGVRSVKLSLTGAHGDMDLYARWDGQMGNYDEADHVAASNSADEELFLDRLGAPRLRTGVYYVDVTRVEPLRREATLTVEYERGFKAEGEFFEAEAPSASKDDDCVALVRKDALFNVALGGEPNYRTFEVNVPRDTESLLVQVRGARADIDLYAKRGSHIEDYENGNVIKANGVGWDEQIYMEGGVESGRYYFDISNYSEEPNVGVVEVLVDYDAPAPSPLPALAGEALPLKFGEPTHVVINRSQRPGARFQFDVPEGADKLYATVFNATRDVDLFLREGDPITGHKGEDGSDFASITAGLNERIVVDDPKAGKWYFDGASLVGADTRIEYDVVVTVDRLPDVRAANPAAILPKPDAPGLTPLERTLLATVEVNCDNGGGSGTCLSADGYIITNYHVLSGEEFQTEDIYISFPTNMHDPPAQLFRAEVIEADSELDLCLLKVSADVFGEPIKGKLALPHLPIGDPESLHIGGDVYVVGYPAVGGDEARSSISLTRGVVTGFSREHDGRLGWIKTDARINAGNSGGTMLSADGLGYIGVPSREIIDADDELGYCRPVSIFPPHFLEHLK